MIATEQQQPLQLARGSVISRRFSDSLLLSVRQGRVWVTQEGRAEDFWLQAGDGMLMRPDCLVVIEADCASEIIIEFAAAPTLAQWGRARLRATRSSWQRLVARTRLHILPSR